jgi:hypothetical protein
MKKDTKKSKIPHFLSYKISLSPKAIGLSGSDVASSIVEVQ